MDDSGCGGCLVGCGCLILCAAFVVFAIGVLKIAWQWTF
jgi:hypothetical protein